MQERGLREASPDIYAPKNEEDEEEHVLVLEFIDTGKGIKGLKPSVATVYRPVVAHTDLAVLRQTASECFWI